MPDKFVKLFYNLLWQEIKQENYLLRECRYGAFSRSLNLPAGLKTDKAEASLENGILT